MPAIFSPLSCCHFDTFKKKKDTTGKKSSANCTQVQVKGFGLSL